VSTNVRAPIALELRRHRALNRPLPMATSTRIERSCSTDSRLVPPVKLGDDSAAANSSRILAKSRPITVATSAARGPRTSKARSTRPFGLTSRVSDPSAPPNTMSIAARYIVLGGHSRTLAQSRDLSPPNQSAGRLSATSPDRMTSAANASCARLQIFQNARLHRRHIGVVFNSWSSSSGTPSNGGRRLPQSNGAPATTGAAAGIQCCSFSPLQVILRKLGWCIEGPSAPFLATLSQAWHPNLQGTFPNTVPREGRIRDRIRRRD
jgi:hypothetical protein